MKWMTALPSMLLLLAACACAYGGSISEKRPLPRIEIVDGEKTLVVLDSLTEAIKISNPGFHIPDNTQIVGSWADFDDDDRLPYATWGDFDGNGLNDVALILVKGATWRLVIFRQIEKGKYKGSRNIIRGGEGMPAGPAQGWKLGLVRKGIELMRDVWDDEGELVGKETYFRFENEGVAVRQGNERFFKLYWDGTKFESLSQLVE